MQTSDFSFTFSLRILRTATMHQYDLCHSWLLDHLVSEICSITELLHIFSFVTRLFIDLVIEGVFFCSANLDVCVCCCLPQLPACCGPGERQDPAVQVESWPGARWRTRLELLWTN